MSRDAGVGPSKGGCSTPALLAIRALPMAWQAGALPFTRGFAAGTEGFPAFAKGFGALLGLHHQLRRLKKSLLLMLIHEGEATLRQKL